MNEDVSCTIHVDVTASLVIIFLRKRMNKSQNNAFMESLEHAKVIFAKIILLELFD